MRQPSRLAFGGAQGPAFSCLLIQVKAQFVVELSFHGIAAEYSAQAPEQVCPHDS